MEPKECIFPQKWQKFQTREEAEKFIRYDLMQEKMHKKFLEIKDEFERRNGKEMRGIFFRWADEDAYYSAQYEIKKILADMNAYFDAKELVDRIENPFDEYVRQYLLNEKQNALKSWRKVLRETGKTPTKKQTENKIAEIDTWAKDVFSLCVEKVKLRYAKAKGQDELEKIALKKRLISALEMLEEKDLVTFKKKLVVDVLYNRFEDRIKEIEKKYSAENLHLPKFEERAQNKAQKVDLER
ncbi:MAG: hypothetical protein J6A98_01440 [Clostridia bacterium]|nr:hypothetical protein [Clostridia bacterium]